MANQERAPVTKAITLTSLVLDLAMESIFITEMVVEIASLLDARSIYAWASTCRFIRRVCRSEPFWKSKVERDFGDVVGWKPKEITFRQQYLDLDEAYDPEMVVYYKRVDLVAKLLKRGIEIPMSFVSIYIDRFSDAFIFSLLLLGLKPDSLLLNYALDSGRLNLVRRILAVDRTIQMNTTKAFASGNLQLVEWLVHNRLVVTHRHLQAAAKHGHLELLIWAKQKHNVYPRLTNDVFASPRTEEILRWLHSEGARMGQQVYCGCVKGGHLSALVWLRSLGVELRNCTHCLGIALNRGHSGIVKYMYDPRGDKGPYLLSLAVGRGDLALTTWFVDEQGVPFLGQGLTSAAKQQKIPMLDWAEARGVYPSPAALDQVVKTELLPTLSWAAERSLFPTQKGVNTATKKGIVATVKLLAEHGLLPEKKAANTAYSRDYTDTLEVLSRYGVERDPDSLSGEELYHQRIVSTGVFSQENADLCAKRGYTKSLIWMMERGVFPSQDGVDESLVEERLDTVKAMGRFGRYPTRSAAVHARTIEFWEVLEWMAEKGLYDIQDWLRFKDE